MKKNLFLGLISIFMMLFVLVSCSNDFETEKVNVTFTDVEGFFLEEIQVLKGHKVEKPADPTRDGYIFLGWTNSNDGSEYDFSKPVFKDTTIIAKWKYNGSHTHSYDEEIIAPTCIDRGYTIFTCECGVSYIDNYVSALEHDLVVHESKLPTNTEIGWNEYVTCNRCDYTTYEELPVLKKEYLELEVFEENGNKYLYFGKYPQTHVNDNTLISQLNNLTVQNINGYYELNQKEYAKVVSFGYSGDEVFSTGSTVVNGQVEWFIVEPIKWRIIYESADNKLTLLSELIIDSGYIYKGNSDFKLEDRIIGDKVICPNNYEFSMMREYLNSTFIDMAFSTEKLQYISDTVVDNSADTTMDNLNQYACSNTVDKVFLLSYQDMFNPLYNFTSERIDPARESFGTDYAIAKGLWMNCWSLRSPDHGDKNYMMSVGVGGYAYYQNLIVNSSGHGIRPALVLDLN